jgi:hypothetical protein
MGTPLSSLEAHQNGVERLCQQVNRLRKKENSPDPNRKGLGKKEQSPDTNRNSPEEK